MDLFETTLKVLENRNAAQEDLTLSKQDLEQYEDYIGQLKQQLKELEANSSQNTQILEVNNFTKEEFNSHSVETKKLFGMIYGYVQQIEDNLSTMRQRESVLYNLCNENGDRLKKAELNFVNALKVLDIMKKDGGDKSLQEATEIQKEISATDAEIEDVEKTLSSTMVQYEEKLKELSPLKVELEILEDKIETETQQQQSLIDENKSFSRQRLEEINSDTEMHNKILDIEASILSVTQKLKEVLAGKCEILQKQIASQINLEQLEKEASELEIKIQEVENERDQSIEKITKEIESMKLLIDENKSKVADSARKSNEIGKETEELNAKINILKDELLTMQNKVEVEEKELLQSNNLEEIAQEHEDLVKSSEKFLALISESDKKIEQKQKEFDLLKNTPNTEIMELKLKIKRFDVEVQKKNELEKEIGVIDLRNKNLQQNVERHQITIRDLVAMKQKLEQEREENQKGLKTVTTKCELMQKRINSLEAQKKESAKVFSKPPIKQTRLNTPKQQTKKRGFTMDVESDSSVDGERLSYAEFMARKKMLKENKKQKRNTK